MATDTERLIVTLEASVGKFQRELAKANGTANRQARSIERRFQRMNSVVSRQFSRIGAGLAGAVSLRAAQRLVDAATRIDNALKVAGLSGDDLRRVYDDLFASAQRNAAPIESLVELYGRAAQVQKELGISTEELLGFTDKVAVALRVSGKSAAESSGALLQLSQALGSGVVRAEEFNSILEGALPIAQAAAAGLEEAGGSVAKLRQLVIDGKISSEAFFRAFEAGSVILDEKVAGAQLTISQGFTNIENALIRTAGEFDRATGASEKTGEALNRFAIAVEEIGDFFVRFAEGPIGTFIGKLDELDAALRGIAERLSFLTLNDEILGAIGDFIAPPRQPQAAADHGPTDIGTIRPVRTVSVKDCKAPTSSGGKSKLNDYQREKRQIEERTAALIAETKALAALNPLVEDYGAALEIARTRQELETAAKRAGLALTPELRAQIEQLSGAYVQASVAAAQLAESQEKARERAEDMRLLGKDVLSGFISDLRRGTTAAEALQNALNKVLDKLIDISLNSIFDAKSSTGGGIFGAIGKLFGFADGGIAARGKPVPIRTFAKGGIARSASVFGEAGPEAAVPLPDGRNIPVDLRIPSTQFSRQQVQELRIIGTLVDDRGVVKAMIDQTVVTAAPQIAAAGARQAVRDISPGGKAAKGFQSQYNLNPRGRRAS